MSTQPVQIVARIRPPLLNEQTDDAISVIPIPPGHALTAARPIPFTSWVSISSTGMKTGTTQVQNSQTAFHTAFGPETTQLQLFDTAVAPHLLPLLKGHTLTILAYGPTSSGKTHTMEGSSTEPGIIPRSVRNLFDMSEELKESGRVMSFEVHMSYLELYKDDAFDLLVSQSTHEKLPIRTNAKGETFVVGLTRVPIRSFEDWKNVFRAASQNRTTGATLLNRASSRSHAMLSIELEVITAPTPETREMTYNGKINLVDLAGSENNKHTGNSLANPTRLAESAAINKSLSTLGQVVHALNTGASRIPYRDSNLTRLLSASLGRKALGKTILLCNLAPGVKFRSDVLNTLNFASRTKNIETTTVVNEREKPAPVEVIKERETIPPVGPLTRRTSIQSRRVSASHIPAPGSRIPSYGAGSHSRLSGFGLGPTGTGAGLGKATTIDDADLNERINKAVETEVKRRLEEQEAQRRMEEEEREKKLQEARQLEMESQQHILAELRAVEGMDVDQRHLEVGHGVLGSSPVKVDPVEYEAYDRPIPKGEREDDDKERSKMGEIEKKYREHIAQLEAQLAAASSKKMGKIYVDLARGYTAKHDLATALSLYRHAALFVPDNTKLRERIIDVEWAVKNGKSYVPTPKRQHPREEEEKPMSKSSKLSKSHR
ncbi:kinesin-domain-containing protein, partial [Lentinula aff. detonsa]